MPLASGNNFNDYISCKVTITSKYDHDNIYI
jgi:hypothetical protein